MRIIQKIRITLEFLYFYKCIKINKNIEKPIVNKKILEEKYPDTSKKLLDNDIKILPYLDKKKLTYNQKELATNYVMRNDKFFNRYEILNLSDKGLKYLKKYYKDTHYYKIRLTHSNDWKIAFKIFKYYKLFKSIQEKGFIPNLEYEFNYPIVFMSKNYFRRLDGAHRVSVLRYLGYKTITVNLITPKEALELKTLPNEMITKLNKMECIKKEIL